jgi:hypothetical protein
MLRTMIITPRPLLLVLGALCGESLLWAESPPEEPTRPPPPAQASSATTPAALAAHPNGSAPAPAPRPSAARAVSPAIANMLAASMPSFNPPTSAPEPTEEDTEGPRNQIIRLPEMIVEGERPPVFTEREIHTKKGLAELAMSRYLSEVDRGVLNRFRLPFIGMTNEGRALEQFREDERLRYMAMTQDQIEVLRQTNPEEAARMQQISRDTFIRRDNLPPPTVLRRD